MKKQGLGSVLVFGGGIIPDEDVPALKKKGVAAVFGPGTPTDDIVAFLRQRLAPAPAAVSKAVAAPAAKRRGAKR
jgi:methylmalonyl-CoA mutase cobalamin-binding domain/chain